MIGIVEVRSPGPDLHTRRGIAMRLREALDALGAGNGAAHVYGQPYETIDGATIITVARVRGRLRAGKPEADDASGREVAVTARPVGVFVIRDGQVSWQPAVDVTRIAIWGEIIGLVAAGLATLALVRRPPWPDLSGPAFAEALRDRRNSAQR